MKNTEASPTLFTNPLVRWASRFYIVLTLLGVVAFWPGYLVAPQREPNGWVHFHVVTAASWMVLLIIQPWLIQSGRRAIHVFLGRFSLFLVPLVVIGFAGLAHSSMQGKSAQGQAVDAYFLYIRVVLVAIFIATYVLAVVYRKDAGTHSRYMVCTGLPMIDPVVHRISARMMGGADHNYQLATFGITCALLVALILAERHVRSGRHVFPGVLLAFIVGGVPLAFNFYTWGAPWSIWKSVSRWFVSLPLT